MDLKPNQVILFPRQKKPGEETRPDYDGFVQLPGGEIYRVALWNHTSKAGNPYLKGRIEPSDEGQAPRREPRPEAAQREQPVRIAEAPEAGGDDEVDDLPF